MTRVSDSTPSELEVAKPDDDDAFPVAVRVICGSLPDVYVEKLLGFVAACLEKSGHLQFYMMWAQNLLMLHGQSLKNRCVNTCHLSLLFHMCNYGNVGAFCRSAAMLPTLQALQKSIQTHFDSLSKL